MIEYLLHVLIIWVLLSLTLVLGYGKFVVSRQLQHNLYMGKNRYYNKKKVRSTYIKSVVLSGVLASLVVYCLALFT
jgi:hypothetical protein